MTVERGARNSRRLYAAVQIAAPINVVWGALTDYEGLGSFIPGRKLKQSVTIGQQLRPAMHALMSPAPAENAVLKALCWLYCDAWQAIAASTLFQISADHGRMQRQCL